MNQRLVVRYSIGFKRQVVEQLESGRFSSICQAKAHYGINGAETIKRWLRQYGRNKLCPKVVRVEKPDEKDQIRQLKQQLRAANRSTNARLLKLTLVMLLLAVIAALLYGRITL